MKKRKQHKQTMGPSAADDTKTFLDMLLPSAIRFYPGYFICGNTYRAVWAIRDYPANNRRAGTVKASR